MVSLIPSVYHLMQSLSLAIFVLYLTLLRINYGQSKGSMRLAFAYVPGGGGVFLVSWFLRTLLRNRFCGSIELGTSCGRRSTVLCSSARGRRRAWSVAGVPGDELRMV